jgi:hypothetical protein
VKNREKNERGERIKNKDFFLSLKKKREWGRGRRTEEKNKEGKTWENRGRKRKGRKEKLRGRDHENRGEEE